MAKVEVLVLAYPPNDDVLRSTIQQICDFANILNTTYKMNIELSINDADEKNAEYTKFVTKFLSTCLNYRSEFDIACLSALNSVIDDPTSDVVNSAEECIDDLGMRVRPLFQKVLASKRRFVRPNSLFVALRGFPLIQSDYWGVTTESFYPKAISAEIKGYEESVYHEFLHQIGASEGYNVTTKKTLPGCERCWMQFNATKGTGLCERHIKEVKDFLASISA
ncbi:MAG: hypothetical protein WC581_06970 [Thermodesulfovibrionales bacterium]